MFRENGVASMEMTGEFMGRVHQFFQPPLYWQQFEDLCVGMLREVYSSADAQA